MSARIRFGRVTFYTRHASYALLILGLIVFVLVVHFL